MYSNQNWPSWFLIIHLDEDASTSDEDENVSSTSSDPVNTTSRNISPSNTFPCPVVVYNITLPPYYHKHFKVIVIISLQP